MITTFVGILLLFGFVLAFMASFEVPFESENQDMLMIVRIFYALGIFYVISNMAGSNL